ncbi:MAG: formylglycine-generating enzyme family protein [Candidatus Hydrogenedentes bacterium]|nr:formylglycine-generating enzyme family protein [Candidatus Hydrogenedentota bacterium]
MTSLSRTLLSLVGILLVFVALNTLILYIDSTFLTFIFANLMVLVDTILGSWLILPPFLSWTLTGFIAGAFLYLSIIEGHRFNSRTLRVVLVVVPAAVLVIAPLVWARVELRYATSVTFEEKGLTRPGEERRVGDYWFVWAPPGRFRMGSPDAEPDRAGDELAHVVTITRGFWLGKFEVTQRQWREVMGGNPSRFAGCDSCPLESVSPADCMTFISELSTLSQKIYRLPTEAEWEYAARAGTQSAWASGNDSAQLDEFAWHSGNSEQKTHPVGEKRPNPWGLYDMEGNVREWCADWYQAYSAERQIDPQGPDWGELHVTRGGGWASSPADCRSARRETYQEGYFQPKDDIGFRLVLEDEPAPPPEPASDEQTQEQDTQSQPRRKGRSLVQRVLERNKAVDTAADGEVPVPERSSADDIRLKTGLP